MPLFTRGKWPRAIAAPVDKPTNPTQTLTPQHAPNWLHPCRQVSHLQPLPVGQGTSHFVTHRKLLAEQPSDPTPTTTSDPSDQQPGNNPAASLNPDALLAADPNSPTTKATQPEEAAGKKPAEQEDTKKTPELPNPASLIAANLISYDSLMSRKHSRVPGVPKTAVSAAGPEGQGGAVKVTGGSNHRLLHHLRALLAEVAADPIKPSSITMGVVSAGSDAVQKEKLQQALDAAGADPSPSKLLEVQMQLAQQEQLTMQQAAIVAAMKKTTNSILQKMGR